MKLLFSFIAVLVVATSVFAQVEEEDVRPRCPCPRIYQPLCASDGLTYPNACEFECVLKRTRDPNFRIIKSGRCEEE